MILESLRLSNWRNYEATTVSPGPKTNLVVGVNGAGKTNLAEAIYYLSIARSWRGSDDKRLIRDGAPSCYVEGVFRKGGRTRRVGIEISAAGKKVLIDDKPIRRTTDLAAVANVLAFSPTDVPLFSGPPADRRAFLDLAIGRENPAHLKELSRVAQILKERNAALKSEFRNDGYVEVLTNELIAAEKPVVLRRQAYVGRLIPAVRRVADKIFGRERPIDIVYQPFLDPGNGYEEAAKALYRDTLEGDYARGTTAQGVHKEDFRVMLDGLDVGGRGSQGENRILSLALHLAPFFLIEDEADKPIVVLDDVYSELDEQHAEGLTAILEELGQVFITATNKTISGASVIEVADHKAIRRE